MTNYELTIQHLNRVRQRLQDQLTAIRKAASISFDSWDSDTRAAYENAIMRIERELSSIIYEISKLKQYIYKEDDPK